MKRREYILSAGACIGLAAYGVGGTSEPSLSITAPAVNRGETATVSVETPETSGFRFSDIPSTDDIVVEFEDASFSPSPDRSWLSSPPSWEWTTPTAVAGDVPVRVASDAAPGTYPFAVTARVAGREDDVLATADLTVEGA